MKQSTKTQTLEQHNLVITEIITAQITNTDCVHPWPTAADVTACLISASISPMTR